MESTTPVRALVTTGATMLLMLGGGTVALPATTAVSEPTQQTSTSTAATAATTPATVATTTKVLARRHHGKHHRRKHQGRRHQTRHSAPHVSAVHAVTTRRWVRALDTNDLNAVNASYQAEFASGLDVPTGFTGDESRCLAGSSSAQSMAATLRAVNFVRSLAGLAPVTFNAELNKRSQLTALMMSANHALSHSPSRSWRCYTSTGAANAGRSNLVLSYPEITSAGLVRLYTTDPGANNGAAGHRRWLLNPFATTMGTGSTRAANAITVIGPSSSSRPSPPYVSWPTAGWFPNTLEPGGRWSLSSGDRAASFSDATVSVYRNGTIIRTTKNHVESGYAQPTLVWQIAPSQAQSGTFRVVVRGIRLGGRSYTTAYDVRMFAPH